MVNLTTEKPHLSFHSRHARGLDLQNPRDVALLAQMGQHRVENTGFRAPHLNSDPISVN